MQLEPAAGKAVTRRRIRPWFYKTFMIVIGLVFMNGSLDEHGKHDRLVAGGHSAILDPTKGFSKRHSRNMDYYEADFSFRTDSGRDVKHRAEFPEKLLDDLRAHRPVRIYYDANDPRVFVFERNKPGWMPFGFGLAVLVAAFLVP